MKINVKQSPQKIVAVKQAQQKIAVAVGVQGPSGNTTRRLLEAEDVVIDGIEDGSILVYKSETQKLHAVKISKILEGGTY